MILLRYLRATADQATIHFFDLAILCGIDAKEGSFAGDTFSHSVVKKTL